jgi:nucleoside 2-deoxyribosyltransferase
MTSNRKLIYLASPYSHPNPAERKRRYDLACIAAAQLMNGAQIHGEPLAVFCPIAHSHEIGKLLPEEKATDHQFWMEQDLPVLERCDVLLVLQIDGWDQSRGVKEEIFFARWKGIPVEYCHLAAVGEDENGNVHTVLHCTKDPIQNWDHKRFMGNPAPPGVDCYCS